MVQAGNLNRAMKLKIPNFWFLLHTSFFGNQIQKCGLICGCIQLSNTKGCILLDPQWESIGSWICGGKAAVSYLDSQITHTEYNSPRNKTCL